MAIKKHKELLVIRLSAMGDVAMIVPVLRALQNSQPDVKVVLLTKKHFAPIFTSLSSVIIHAVDVKSMHKGLWGVFKIFKELRRYEIDAVADLHNVLRSNLLKLLFGLKGKPVVQIDKGRKEKKALTEWNASKELRQLETTHQRYANVFDKLGLPIMLNNEVLLKKQDFPKNFNPNRKTLIGIAPFASFKGKVYSLEMMQQLLDLLLNQVECQILLFGGGEKEKKDLQILEDKYGEQVQSLAGKLSFEDELAIISNLNLMISMDSGNGHLAANYGVPVITLWGVTHPCLGFAPFNQPIENMLLADRSEFHAVPTSVYGNKYPEGYEKAIESITPAAIAKRALEILKK